MEASRFSPEDVDEGVEVSSDGCGVYSKQGRKNTWLGARGRPGVLHGLYQFEVKVLGNSLIRVGWAASFSSRNIGTDAHSFGYGGTAMKSSNRKFERYGEDFNGLDGAVVTCLIDRRTREEQTISYCLDGKYLGVAFTLPTKLADVALFPAICGREAWTASCQFRDFSFLQQGYSPLAEAPLQGHAILKPIMPGLCSADADSGVEISEDGKSANGRSPEGKWLGARARPGVIQGAYQVDFELRSESLIRVGWATSTSRKSLGCDAKSFGYGGTAKKSHAGNFEDYGEEFQGKIGSVVSCLIDRSAEHQTISYCINGKNLGVAFEVPESLVSEPLFPAVCGKGCWRVTCHVSQLLRPLSGYEPICKALLAGDATQGPGELKPPSGKTVSSTDHAEVQVGRRVVLHVRSGPWQGWYMCCVVDADDMGCYLKHDEDGFTENVPWAYLGGQKFAMQLLPENVEVQKHAQKNDVELNCQAEHPVALQSKTMQASQKSSTEFLRRGFLRVDSGGAGLELSPCQAGLFVEQIEALPGQPDLRRGFAIVAIQGKLLLGLDEDIIHSIFGGALKDGVEIVAGPSLEMQTVTFEEIRKQALQLMSAKRVPEQFFETAGSLLRACSTPLSTSGLLCRTALRVAIGLGAGLELESSDLGFVVTAIEREPGQNLKVGDAILAIGGKTLLGCSEEEIEARFRDAFRHGSALICGPAAALQSLPAEQVQGMVHGLLSLSLDRTETI
mmetsp:Transcript_71764/g.126686  ORF Transcript_71764/g.126686 Transcript_71764/m.126686 type:complete len:731 (-) Transcript_71764:249-2441(-)|eukprot:CAMPEP_0197633446 /NCGR_PEP_ID=MMETSP1338-20131121/9812_1 /TAXON_ID=43686 ORGANISM="Pelagodinium beii, Strain RCC1491" /NCGR_SAMPLE_ID=MMETSP1338 /ASSEMBLY_ACC=CAM_ASM_000754 /LENGTH=730 /DNA_ID=CAMNT_0043205111 /DNA_START=100 /DNA_END=2292 /DNA_ORIENTATION=-